MKLVLSRLCSTITLAGLALFSTESAHATSLLAAQNGAMPVAVDTEPDSLTPQDWHGLHDAYEKGRHAARRVEGCFEAWNPGQGWRITFDTRGFQLVPDHGAWTWGLQLESYGSIDCMQDVQEQSTWSSAKADEGRLGLRWSKHLEEWYVNDRRGLEHGFTLEQRPGGEAGTETGSRLRFCMSVRGGLEPKVSDDERSAQFLTDDGSIALTYSGLIVVDANGCSLPARLEASDGGLLLEVDDSRAEYPIVIDPIAQEVYLKAGHPDSFDRFAASVARWGNTVVVGALGDDSNATGVNGDETDNSSESSGAAYVFVRSGGGWSQQAFLKASNTDTGDVFGVAVAIHEDTIVVGALGEDSNATGVNGDQADNSLPGVVGAGAAYVFVRSGTTWQQQAYLKASNTGADDLFGTSVAVHGNTILVGAPAEASSAAGINGVESDDSMVEAGAAYVFTRDGSSWSQQAYLKASNTGAFDGFGGSIGLSGDTAVIGAVGEDSDGDGVNGDQASDWAANAGAAYVFIRSGSTWSQQAYLKAGKSDAGDRFGGPVAISGDLIVVGATGEDGGSNGVNGNENDNSRFDSGAAYVFERVATHWLPEAYLKSSNADFSDWFGGGVAIDGRTIAVGAIGEDSSSQGPNGDQTDQGAADSGAVYIFTESGDIWSQRAYLKASNPDPEDYFGLSSTVWRDSILVGARDEDSSSGGVNADQNDNSASQAGAAYVFTLDAYETAFCFGDGSGTACPCTSGAPGSGCPNSTGSGARLEGFGMPFFESDTFGLLASRIRPSLVGVFVKGSVQTAGGLGNVIGDGLLCTSPQLRSQLMVSGNAGEVALDNWRGQRFSEFPGAANVGASTYYQFWYRDSVNSCTGQGFNFSPGLSVTWQ